MKTLRFLSLDEPFLPNSHRSAAIATSCVLGRGRMRGCRSQMEDAGWEAGTPGPLPVPAAVAPENCR